MTTGIQPHPVPITRDPLTPGGGFAIDWTNTGYRDGYAPTDPQLIVTILPGRWIDDSGALVTTAPVSVALADGTNAIQLDRASGAIVADTVFNPDAIPLYLIDAVWATQRIVSVIDARGLAGLPAGA
jgi:hypothetical protein